MPKNISKNQDSIERKNMKKIILFSPADGTLNSGDYIIDKYVREEMNFLLSNSITAEFGTHLPIARFMPNVANGYLEISDIASTFFCSTEHDIWRLVAEKEIMDVSSLYAWYKGQNLEPILEKVTGIPCQNEKDDDKAEEFLTFLLDEKTNATDKVRMNAIALRQLSTQFTAND